MPPARRKNGCNRKIPKAVVDRMKAAGVDFTAAQYQGRDILKCGVGDDAARIYLEWIDTVSDDPDVFAIFAPTGGVVPPPAQGFPLTHEANSIISHASVYQMADFAGGNIPAIPPPIAGFIPVPIAVHHASVAGTYLITALQNPPPPYQAINNLGTGTYICTLVYQCSGVAVFFQVTKG
jgi:hypothetical protein